MTASVHDVAAYILQQCGSMSAMKLQKLVYYSQAWHLTWEERALFDSEVQAWANGPVVYELYNRHRGQFTVSDWTYGDVAALDPNERESIDVVLSFYGKLSAYELSELTHREDPWRQAREGLAAGERGDNVISHASMAEYYQGLAAALSDD